MTAALGQLREELMEGDAPAVAVMGLDLAANVAAAWAEGEPVAPSVLEMIYWIADDLLMAHSEELDERSTAIVQRIRAACAPQHAAFH